MYVSGLRTAAVVAWYLRTYPNCKVLSRFVAIEKRLADLGASVAKAR